MKQETGLLLRDETINEAISTRVGGEKQVFIEGEIRWILEIWSSSEASVMLRTLREKRQRHLF